MTIEGKRQSIPLTEGPSRAAARSYLRGAGFCKEDLHKPIIGIANTWTEIGTCNVHLREVAEALKEGIREAGGTPMEFNTITISDGITMGTQGMKASLVSREVIADSIELAARGNLFDGLVGIGGCDKNMPGIIMALCRLDIPGMMLYGGSIAPGKLNGSRHHHPECIRRHRLLRRRQNRRRRPRSPRSQCLPRRGRMRRPVHRQHHGHERRDPRHLAHSALRRSRHRQRQVRGHARSRPHDHGCGARQSQAFADHHPQGPRKHHRQRRGQRRIDQRGAASHRHCARDEHSPVDRRLRRHLQAHPVHLRPDPGGQIRRFATIQAAGGSRLLGQAAH